MQPQFAEAPTIVEVKPETIRVVSPGCKMHGVVVNAFSFNDDDCCIIAFETPDNQLDFNMIYLTNIDDASQFTYKWEQYRIVNPRVNHKGPDPIVKTSWVFYGGFMFCVSLRQSGYIDLYWNMARRESPTDGNPFIV